MPYAIGKMQGFVLEKLPPSLFTLTRDQVRRVRSKIGDENSHWLFSQVEQLKIDNVAGMNPPPNCASFAELVENFTGERLKSVHDILPSYL